MTKNVAATSYSMSATGTGGTFNSWEPSGSVSDPAPTSVGNLLIDGFETGDMSAPNSGANVNTVGFAWDSNNRTSVVTMDNGAPTAIYNNGVISNVDSTIPTKDWTAKKGSNSLRFRYPANDSQAEQRFTFTPQTELWLRYWTRVPENYVHGIGGGGAVNNKFLSLWMDGYEGAGDGSTFWLSMESAGDGDTNLAFTYTLGGNTGSLGMQQPTAFISSPEDQGRWMQITVHLKAESSDGADDGEIEVWRRWEFDESPTKFHEKLDAGLKLPTSPLGFAAGYLYGWANGQYAEETEFLIDDVHMSTASLL